MARRGRQRQDAREAGTQQPRGGQRPVLPHHLVHDELQAGALTASRLLRPGFPRILSLAASTRHPGSAATRAVWREIRDVSQAHLVGKVWR